jgi:SNF2 family DNA or RNA helicase
MNYMRCGSSKLNLHPQGCILADDMGLGKTLMSITLLWTLLNQGMGPSPTSSAVRKVVVVCPTSLVGNWDNELRRWIGDHCPTFAVKTDPKKMIKQFLQHRGKGVLIVSYETQRLYSKLFENATKAYNSSIGAGGGAKAGGKVAAHAAAGTAVASDAAPVVGLEGENRLGEALATTSANGPKDGAAVSHAKLVQLAKKHSNNNVCDLLICDEAHKLKNADSGLAKSLNLLPARKRILLSGTPMQNELTEFFNMVDFCNPNVLGTNTEFKKRFV